MQDPFFEPEQESQENEINIETPVSERPQKKQKGDPNAARAANLAKGRETLIRKRAEAAAAKAAESKQKKFKVIAPPQDDDSSTESESDEEYKPKKVQDYFQPLKKTKKPKEKFNPVAQVDQDGGDDDDFHNAMMASQNAMMAHIDKRMKKIEKRVSKTKSVPMNINVTQQPQHQQQQAQQQYVPREMDPVEKALMQKTYGYY